MYSSTVTAELSHVAPRVWLTDVLARIADQHVQHLYELLLANWRKQITQADAAA